MNISLAELSQVKGIGKKTIQRIKKELLSADIKDGEFKGKELNTNNIYLGDTLKLMDNIKDNSIDLIVTDPPYKVTSRGNAGNSGGMLQKDVNRKGLVFDNNNLEIEDWIYKLYRVLKPRGHCYIMTNHKNLQEYLNVTKEAGFKFIKNLIWNKGNKIMGQYYMNQYEYILFLRKGGGKKINNCGTADILNVPNKKHKHQDGTNWHDTEKPVELMDILIKNSSNEDDVILDPFMGVGSVCVSAKRNNRRYIGIEINEEYYKISKKRIEETL